MFGENATNFFYHAFESNLLTNIYATDAGYLPWTQRILAVMLVKVFNIIELYPFVSQGIAILLIAVFSSLVNFSVFKKLNPSALIRFIIGIALGLISDFELNVFINFIYYGALFLLFAIIINKEKLSRPLLIIVSLGAALIMLSKGQFISFVPLFMLMAFIHFRKRQNKSLFFYLSVIIAGILQLIVMMSNAPENSSSLNILLLPYYGIKTVYYLVLTYRHVFFGFITKESINLISIGILTVLFTIGIKNLIYKKDTFTLSVFLAGNFIAVCSLFLTIVLYSQSNPNVTNIAKTVNNAPSVIAATGQITNQVYDNAQRTKNIFDVKHHANARALFISNSLIFLVGIFVLLKIFPKQRDRLIFLFIIFITSGAFGQIQVEQMYMNKSYSYSQWRTYYPLLFSDHYCIPVNNYPFLLKKNCDYLLMSKQELQLASPARAQSIVLSHITPLSKNWEIHAVVLINKPNHLPDNIEVTLSAYDSKEKVVGTAKQLVPSDYEYVYYLFDKPISSAEKLIWRTTEGKEVSVSQSILVYGKDKKDAGIKFEY